MISGKSPFWYCSLAGLAILCEPQFALSDPAPSVPYLEAQDKDGKPVTLPPRYALAIGVKNYLDGRGPVKLSSLESTGKDANDIGTLLKSKAGFRHVDILTPDRLIANPDPDHPQYILRKDILTYIDNLAIEAKKYWTETGRGAVVLVYFAGHGLSDNNEDYLLPAEFDPRIAEDVKDMSVTITQVLDRLSYAHPALAIVISDACRSQNSVHLDSINGDTPGNFFPGGSKDAANKAVRDHQQRAALVFSTLRGSPAKGNGADNGFFTAELLNQLNIVLHDINLDPKARSSGSKLSELYFSLHTRMSVDESRNQVPEEAPGGFDFNIFPTFGDFDFENKNWVPINGLTDFGGKFNDVENETKIYCLVKDFYSKFSPISYYGAQAYDVLQGSRLKIQGFLRDKNEPRCPNTGRVLATTNNTLVTKYQTASDTSVVLFPTAGSLVTSIPTSSFTGFQVDLSQALPHLTMGRNNNAVPPAAAPPPPTITPHAVAPPPHAEPLPTVVTIGDIIRSPSASALAPGIKTELESYGPTTSIDDLRVTLASVRILAAPSSNSAVKSTVDAEKFVQELGVNGDYVNIRTAAGVTGYVSKKLLDTSKIVETFDLTYDKKGVDQKSYDRLSSVMRRIVPVDAVVQYPPGDEDGLVRAADVGLILTNGHLSPSSVIRFVPQIAASDSVPAQTIRLTIAALALEARDRQKPEAIAVVGPEISVATATQASAAVSQQNEGIHSCEALSRSLAGKDLETLAYVRYDGSSDQYALSARVLAALTSVGFHKAPLEKTETSRLPMNQGEIRHCPQLPAELTKAAIDALRACGLGEYKNVSVSGASCQQAPHPNIGIWLARSPASN